MYLQLHHHFLGEVQGSCTQMLQADLVSPIRHKQASRRPVGRSCICRGGQQCTRASDIARADETEFQRTLPELAMSCTSDTYPTSLMPVETSKSPVSMRERAVTLNGDPTHRSPCPSVIHYRAHVQIRRIGIQLPDNRQLLRLRLPGIGASN